MPTIQIKRGLLANLPASGAAGEPIYTTDDQQLHFGTGAAVVPLKIAAGNVVGLVNGGSELVNAQTGTTYTILAGDLAKLVTFANVGAVAVTVPQATGSFPAGFWFDVENKGAGDATFTPTTSTIDGAASLVLHAKQGLRIVSDGTNWQVKRGIQTVASTAPANQFATGVDGTGVVSYAQPSFTNISGTLAAGQLPATIDGGTF